ncbi:MAG TPA: DoxX family protein [Bacteroidetes bacterium]|nr:DoxX family protein [Bacteroidota bacterium]
MKKNNWDIALLILRIGIGFSVAYAHGWGKITGGEEKWLKLGTNMSLIGITFAPVFCGFMAAFSEFAGSIMIGLGFFTRLSSFFLAFTMFIAFYMHIHDGDGFGEASHSFDLLIVSLFFLVAGAGKYSLDSRFRFSRWLQ